MSGVQLVEVGPRDGFQSVAPMIPTEQKIDIIRGLHKAGLRRMEVTSFVSETALPQMADAAAIVSASTTLAGLDAQVLVPNVRHAERALAAGAMHLSFVLSASEAHNRSNVRRSPAESALDYARVVGLLPAGAKIRLNIATAFDCPYAGRMDEAAVLALLDDLVATAPTAEIALCDTTGRVLPNHVASLFGTAIARFPTIERWAFHAHDTYGLGAANALSAWQAGVRIFDGSVAGLGGCPFAPGATGNVATEDLVWMFDGMGEPTGIDLLVLAQVADTVAVLPGAAVGGRVRTALAAKPCRKVISA